MNLDMAILIKNQKIYLDRCKKIAMNEDLKLRRIESKYTTVLRARTLREARIDLSIRLNQLNLQSGV